MISDQKIYEYACIYKSAIIAARDEGLFDKDFSFSHFPRGCCGDTCYLLAAFLQSKGVKTIYVWGDYRGQSHAWLVVNDYRVNEPTPRFYETPSEINEILKSYGCDAKEGPIDVTHYEDKDVSSGLVVDITADQFGEDSVYVGYINDFYSKFRFRAAHECGEIEGYRLCKLYEMVSNVLGT